MIAAAARASRPAAESRWKRPRIASRTLEGMCVSHVRAPGAEPRVNNPSCSRSRATSTTNRGFPSVRPWTARASSSGRLPVPYRARHSCTPARSHPERATLSKNAWPASPPTTSLSALGASAEGSRYEPMTAKDDWLSSLEITCRSCREGTSAQCRFSITSRRGSSSERIRSNWVTDSRIFNRTCSGDNAAARRAAGHRGLAGIGEDLRERADDRLRLRRAPCGHHLQQLSQELFPRPVRREHTGRHGTVPRRLGSPSPWPRRQRPPRAGSCRSPAPR